MLFTSSVSLKKSKNRSTRIAGAHMLAASWNNLQILHVYEGVGQVFLAVTLEQTIKQKAIHVSDCLPAYRGRRGGTYILYRNSCVFAIQRRYWWSRMLKERGKVEVLVTFRFEYTEGRIYFLARSSSHRARLISWEKLRTMRRRSLNDIGKRCTSWQLSLRPSRSRHRAWRRTLIHVGWIHVTISGAVCKNNCKNVLGSLREG